MTDIVERLNGSLSAGYSELRKEAAVTITRLRAKLEAAEKSDAESIAMYRRARDERDALRAELDALKAWRTYDGEGGYDYHGVDGNEDYRDEFIERNPGHANWVDAPYTRPAPAQGVPERITHDQASHVYSQEAAEGYADGWNACVKKIVAAAPQNCIKAAMEAQREGCAEIVLQAAHKAADCNNLRDYELLRALSIEVAKAPEVKP